MCGIGGMIGKINQEEEIKIKFLLTMLSTRGTDNTGIGILNSKNRINIVKTNEEAMKFNKTLKIPYSRVPTTISLHARKSSVGGLSAASGHPFGKGYYKKEVETDPTEYAFSIVKNGTLSNWKELLKKYNPLSEDFTKNITVDSDALGYLLYTNTDINIVKEILKEYIGGCAFIVQLKDRLVVFKGASKEYKSSNILTEERPLYKGVDKKGNIWFSSEEWMLNTIGVKDIEDLPCNVLISYNLKGEEISRVEIDRSNSLQRETVVYTNYGYGGGWGGQRGNYADYEDYDYPTASKKNLTEEQKNKLKVLYKKYQKNAN